MRSTLPALIRLARPAFLLGGLLLYALGALVARYQGLPLEWDAYLVGQLFVTSLQLTTHYLIEYWDRAGQPGGEPAASPRDPPGRRLSPQAAFNASAACMALNSAAAIALVFQYQAGPVTWAIMLLAFLGAFFYATPPVSLRSTGYGELTTSVIVAGLVPAFSHALQSGRPSVMIVLATAPLVLFHYAMLLAYEFQEFLSDEAAGKRTLLVRLGRRQGAALHNGLIAGGLVLTAGAAFLGLPRQVAISITIAAPLAAWQVIAMRRIRRGDPVSPGRFTFGATALFTLTAYLFAFSFWVLG